MHSSSVGASAKAAKVLKGAASQQVAQQLVLLLHVMMLLLVIIAAIAEAPIAEAHRVSDMERACVSCLESQKAL